MGILHDAAAEIWRHVRTRDQNLEVRERFETQWQAHEPRARQIAQRLWEIAALPDRHVRFSAIEAFTKDREQNPILVRVSLPEHRFAQGRMRWGEEWQYPSAAVLAYVGGSVGYAGNASRPSSLRRPFDGRLMVVLEADGQQVYVIIPLGDVRWTQPRGTWDIILKPAAIRDKKAGKIHNKLSELREDFLKEFQAPNAQLGQCEWVMCITKKTTPGEILANLVIGALRVGFLVSAGEDKAMRAWVQHIVRDADLVPEVVEVLWKSFELPYGTLQGFVRQVARQQRTDRQRRQGRNAQPKLRKLTRPGDPQECVYPPSTVAQMMFEGHQIAVSERTVYRWMASKGFTEADDGTRGLTAEQLHQFTQDLYEKQLYRMLKEYLIAERGMTKEQAKDWIKYQKKKGECPQDMVRTLKLPQQPQAEC